MEWGGGGGGGGGGENLNKSEGGFVFITFSSFLSLFLSPLQTWGHNARGKKRERAYRVTQGEFKYQICRIVFFGERDALYPLQGERGGEAQNASISPTYIRRRPEGEGKGKRRNTPPSSSPPPSTNKFAFPHSFLFFLFLRASCAAEGVSLLFLFPVRPCAFFYSGLRPGAKKISVACCYSSGRSSFE